MNDPHPRGKQNSAYRSAPHYSGLRTEDSGLSEGLIKPRAISRDARIAVLAISSPSELERILEAKAKLESCGARVTIAENIAQRHRGYLAGTDDERVEQLNRYLNSPE